MLNNAYEIFLASSTGQMERFEAGRWPGGIIEPGMSMREIAVRLRGLYGIEVSSDLISTVKDAVIEEVTN